MKSKITKRIAIVGMMVALSLVIDVVSVKTDFTKISLYALPLLMLGILFDYKYGLIGGFVEGLLSQLILYPQISITTPLWMLAPMLWGFLSGILFKNLKIRESIKIVVVIFITSVIVLAVNTGVSFLDAIIWKYSYDYVLVNLGIRIITCLIVGVLYSGIIIVSYKPLKKVIG